MEYKLLREYWKKPAPDAEKFKATLLRKEKRYLPFAELAVDEEVMRFVAEEYWGNTWVNKGPDRESRERYWKNVIDFYYRMGYDYVNVGRVIHFPGIMRHGEDTALLSKDKREWPESKSLISSWQELEAYRWPEVTDETFKDYEFVAANLPEGMGILACPLGGGVLEHAINVIAGYETMSYMVYDDPELAKSIFDRIGDILLESYRRVAEISGITGFFQGEDMGYKTSTLMSPDILRKYIIPYHVEAARIAHEKELVYILHSCGNITAIMDDLITAGIDAKHSFEDAVMPVTEFKKIYGSKLAVVGGIDVNRLAGEGGEPLCKYIRKIIDECTPDGGYILGSGNTIANYVPVDNYFLMLEEGLRRKKG